VKVGIKKRHGKRQLDGILGLNHTPKWITEGNPVIPTTPKAHRKMWLFFIPD
jgi:hypothetical protein